MIRHADSHLDHGLTDEQVAHLLALFADRSAFFIETVELPTELGTVPCGLFGPIMGDAPIASDDVFFAPRPPRLHDSRLVRVVPRPTSKVTVIAGPHDRHDCVLFTAFGGPLSPKEPDDPTIKPEEREASVAFWADHALSSLQ